MTQDTIETKRTGACEITYNLLVKSGSVDIRGAPFGRFLQLLNVGFVTSYLLLAFHFRCSKVAQFLADIFPLCSLSGSSQRNIAFAIWKHTFLSNRPDICSMASRAFLYLARSSS